MCDECEYVFSLFYPWVDKTLLATEYVLISGAKDVSHLLKKIFLAIFMPLLS